jgi:hypothetical protein
MALSALLILHTLKKLCFFVKKKDILEVFYIFRPEKSICSSKKVGFRNQTFTYYQTM